MLTLKYLTSIAVNLSSNQTIKTYSGNTHTGHFPSIRRKSSSFISSFCSWPVLNLNYK